MVKCVAKHFRRCLIKHRQLFVHEVDQILRQRIECFDVLQNRADDPLHEITQLIVDRAEARSGIGRVARRAEVDVRWIVRVPVRIEGRRYTRAIRPTDAEAHRQMQKSGAGDRRLEHRAWIAGDIRHADLAAVAWIWIDEVDPETEIHIRSPLRNTVSHRPERSTQLVDRRPDPGIDRHLGAGEISLIDKEEPIRLVHAEFNPRMKREHRREHRIQGEQAGTKIKVLRRPGKGVVVDVHQVVEDAAAR